MPKQPRRSFGWAVVGVLLVVVGAAVSATVRWTRGSGPGALVLARDVAAGHVLEAADLTTVQLAGPPELHTLTDATGQTLALPLVAGTVLTGSRGRGWAARGCR